MNRRGFFRGIACAALAAVTRHYAPAALEPQLLSFELVRVARCWDQDAVVYAFRKTVIAGDCKVTKFVEFHVVSGPQLANYIVPPGTFQ